MSKSQTYVANSKNSNKPVWKWEQKKDQPLDIKSKLNNETITNLVADLAVVMNEKIRLLNENSSLKAELQENGEKITRLENANCSLSETIANLQQELGESQLKVDENEKLHCESEKQYLTKINYMSDTYYKERDLAVARENDFKNEIADLQRRLEKTKHALKDVSDQVTRSKEKSVTYKEKLKFCVNLITKLNQFFNEVLNTKPNVDRNCQTDESLKRDCSKLTCACSGCSLECENMVLSELFFKENPFTDSIEELFFIKERNVDETF